MKKLLRYAGVGPRETPPNVLTEMTNIARNLTEYGWWLSSGFGRGADQAFFRGSKTHQQTAYVPWTGFNGAGEEAPFVKLNFSERIQEIAAAHHPYWGNMRETTRLLMARNVAILLGNELDLPVSLVIYWQTEESDTLVNSETNHTRRVASTWGIPAFNIRKEEDREALVAFVEEMENNR